MRHEYGHRHRYHWANWSHTWQHNTVSKEIVVYIYGRKLNGRYAAVRIISVLDEYAQKCVEVVSDDGTSEGRPAGRTKDGQEFYEPQIRTPGPPTYPNDIDWRSISFKLMYRILMLPNSARETDGYINFSAGISCPPDNHELFEARHEGYSKLGLEAISIGKELRKEFNLPAMPTPFWLPEWNSEKPLHDKLDEMQKHRSLQASRHVMVDKMEGSEGEKRAGSGNSDSISSGFSA